ncbi:MAG: tRNA pseudouridine(55) synthase TruB [Pseudomonadota bacterium]|jgi:tRNA pseudouridine55 synthase
MPVREKKEHRRVDGVLLLDKGAGSTSNAALQKAKRLYKAVKAGHTGTLDPLATGLLPLCFGEATKFAAGLLDADKSYRARIRLGVTTTTADAEGEVLEIRPVPAVSRAMAEAALARFRGSILQLPPMHSALKRDGKPLYEYARQGMQVQRELRPVTVFRLELERLEGDLLEIAVDCSKGTYIRTLAQDIGEALGCGAHLTALRRTRIGPLRVEGAVTLEALEAMDMAQRDRCLAPVDSLLAGLPAVELDGAGAGRFCHGQAVPVARPAATPAVRVYSGGRFLGLGRVQADGRVTPQRLVVAEQPFRGVQSA